MGAKEILTLQLGPAANELGVHYWNALGVVEKTERTSATLDAEEMPRLVIVDEFRGLQHVRDHGSEEEGVQIELKSLPQWLQWNSSPIDARHYHTTQSSMEQVEDSVRVQAEKCDLLAAFQVVTEVSGYGAVDVLEGVLEDAYPRQHKLLVPLMADDVDLVQCSIALGAFRPHALMPVGGALDKTLLASALDTLNLGGLPWIDTHSTYLASMDDAALFLQGSREQPISIVRGASLAEADFFETQRPYLMVRSEGGAADVFAFTQPDTSVTRLHRNDAAFSAYVQRTFLSGSQLSQRAFAAAHHEYDVRDEVVESLHCFLDRQQ